MIGDVKRLSPKDAKVRLGEVYIGESVVSSRAINFELARRFDSFTLGILQKHVDFEKRVRRGGRENPDKEAIMRTVLCICFIINSTLIVLDQRKRGSPELIVWL